MGVGGDGGGGSQWPVDGKWSVVAQPRSEYPHPVIKHCQNLLTQLHHHGTNNANQYHDLSSLSCLHLTKSRFPE